jgi:hypothetical protein
VKRGSLGFTILELLIATALSAVIFAGLIRLYQSVNNFVTYGRDVIGMQRTICLVFNQFENDLSASYIPFLNREEKEQKSPEAATEKDKDTDKAKEEEEAREKAFRQGAFLAKINENVDAVKIENKRRYPLQFLSFISTNSLSIYGQKKTRLARIVYTLVVDKAASKRDAPVYMLVRKETLHLDNKECKENLTDTITAYTRVRSYVIARNIKGVYADFSIIRKDMNKEKKDEKPKDDKQQREKDAQIITLTSWGDRKEINGLVPQSVTMWIEYQANGSSNAHRFTTQIPIISYPTKEPVKPQEQKTVDANAAAQGQQQNASLGQQQAVDSGQEPIPLPEGAA